MMEPTLHDRTILFLDADCWVFADEFERIFDCIEKKSVMVFGGELGENELWGDINFPDVARKAGYEVRNMWNNSGIFGRAADPVGYSFARLYRDLMAVYPFRPYIESPFWRAADEPYLVTAYQLAHTENGRPVPEKVKTFPSEIFMTTYMATVSDTDKPRPRVTSNYPEYHANNPAIIHFIGGMRVPFYRKLVNPVVSMTLIGRLLRPYFAAGFLYDRVRGRLQRMFR